jgi:catechol 2,3-dioxygenase-like lactoylglutathione lyase family enzyme
MLTFGVVVLGATDRQRAADFWCAALGYEVREDGFGGWARLLVPPGGASRTPIALQTPEGNRFCIVDLAHERDQHS